MKNFFESRYCLYMGVKKFILEDFLSLIKKCSEYVIEKHLQKELDIIKHIV